MSDKTGYVREALTGGGATALDGINGATLSDTDFAFCYVSGILYAYVLDADSAAAESSPNVIAPDTNPGDKRWILQKLGGDLIRMLDTDYSHDLILQAGSNLTADRILTLITGDAARSITLTGNPTLNDWFDQAVKAASSPSFAGVTVSGLTASLPVFSNENKELESKSIADTLTALGLSDAVLYKGAIDCSGNPNYPAANAGDYYRISVAGKIGGASGVVVEVGDSIICNTDSTAAGDQAAVGAFWNAFQNNVDFASPPAIGETTPNTGKFTTLKGDTFDTNVAAAGVTLAGTTLAADGTDDNIDITITPKGSGAVKAGTAEMLDTHYETIYIQASAMTPASTNGAVGGSKEFATNDINADYLAFDPTTEQFADFQLPLPEGWDRGTFKAKFFWSPFDDTGDTAKTVEWEIAAGALSDDDAIDAALGTAQVISDNILAGESADMHITAATPAITCGGSPALGDMIHFKISRNVGGTDDYAANVLLWGVAIQIKVNNSVAAW